jgi:hypothetical protein
LEILEALGLDIPVRKLHCDAAVAIICLQRGYSKVMRYLSKTIGVDIAWLSETVNDLNFDIVKVASADNLADIFTKHISRDVLVKLGPAIGFIFGNTV